MCNKQVMIAEALAIKRETYLAIVMDSSKQGPVLVGSLKGGVNVEDENPEKIFQVCKTYVLLYTCIIW